MEGAEGSNKHSKPGNATGRGKGQSKGSFPQNENIRNSARKHHNGNSNDGKQRQGSGGSRGSSNLKVVFEQSRQQNKQSILGNGHQHFVNGFNQTKGHFGVVYGQSNGNLGNSNLQALFGGLAMKNNSKTTGREGVQGGGKNFVPPQPSPEELTKRLNVEALLRIDKSFTHLHGSASQVAVYDFDDTTGDWNESTTTGCLFIYSRSTKPEYGIVVLNRKGLKNLVMFLDKHTQVMPQDPFLLFRQPNEAIRCLWFYKNCEFCAVTELLKSLGVQFDQDEASSVALEASGGTVNGAGSNLFSMLKQSQSKFEDGNSKAKRAVMTAEQLEQQMYGDAEISQSGVSLLKKFPSVPSSNPLGTNKDLEEKTRESEGSISPRLNDASRSMKTVEQLEKDLVPTPIANKGAVSSRKKDSSTQDMSTELLATLGIKSVKKSGLVDGSKGSAPTSTSDDYSPKSPFMTPASRSRSNSVRSVKKLTIDDLDGKLYEDTDEDMVREVVENLSDLKELLLLSENVEGHLEPQLVWRKRSNLQNRPASALIKMSQNQGTNHSSPRPTQMNGPEITPLTRNQLLQAVTYLIQNDSEFVTKIHEAYIRSMRPS